jgi:hypothetical protein
MRTTPWLLMAGLAACMAAHAGEPAPATEATGSYNGVTVAIDPATGRLRAPTPAEQAALRAKAPQATAARMSTAAAAPKTRADAERTTRRHADGHVSMQVSEDMMSQVVATEQADGAILIQHTDADGNIIEGGAAHE